MSDVQTCILVCKNAVHIAHVNNGKVVNHIFNGAAGNLKTILEMSKMKMMLDSVCGYLQTTCVFYLCSDVLDD